MTAPLHIPVLRDEAIAYLNVCPDGVYVDGTLGLGGHARAILSRLTRKGQLLAFDSDGEAVARCEDLKASPNCRLFQASYDTLPDLLRRLAIPPVDGILLDLGLSSFQLDTPNRGFSFRWDGPLDMRFDRNNAVTAETLVNDATREELAGILRRFGEERKAGRIADAIVRVRGKRRLTTTGDLRALVVKAVPGPHTTKSLARVFQALRIAVNQELATLDRFLEDFVACLAPAGRLVMISYHSLEDRRVKRRLAELARGCVCPPKFPRCLCGKTPQVTLLTRRAVVPSEEERQANPRSRSARLRAAEKR